MQSTSSRNLSIKSVYWNQYMWLSKESPYITREGNPANQNAQWIETSVSGTDIGPIWQYTGTPCSGNSCPGWQRLDNNVASVRIAAGDSKLYQLDNNGNIWRFTGTTCSGDSCPEWQMLDNNPNTGRLAAGGGKLYQLHMARTPMTRAHICYECK